MNRSKTLTNWRFYTRLEKEIHDIKKLCGSVHMIDSAEYITVQIDNLDVTILISKGYDRCSTYPFFPPEVIWQGQPYFRTLERLFDTFTSNSKAYELVFQHQMSCHFCDCTLKKWRSTSRLRNIVHDIRSVHTLIQNYTEVCFAILIMNKYNLNAPLLSFLI